MSQLHFEFEWDEPIGRADPLVKVTMAHLRIVVDDKVVTTCSLGDRTGERVLTPLYPLAEWLAANWWPLSHEPLCVGRDTTERVFLQRHSLLFARDGFALPDLRFLPEGDVVLLRWCRHRMQHQPLEFTADGSARVRGEDLRQGMAGLIEAVLERVASRGHRETWLAEEWRAIQELSPDERKFCVAAAELGIDPFDAADTDVRVMREASNRFDSVLCDDLFGAVRIEHLSATMDWAQRALSSNGHVGQDAGWAQVRQGLAPIIGNWPWEQGYALARHVRQQKGWLGVDSVPRDAMEWAQIVQTTHPPVKSLDGMMVKRAGPVCCTHKQGAYSRRFVCARAIGDFLYSGTDAALLSASSLPHQQLSRAFAAELLAPASLIKSRLSGELVTEEDIDDLAEDFAVSSWVVEHQIRNHRLAHVVP